MVNLQKKAQISLEFLVILIAMIAILIVFLPVFSKLEKSVLLTLDVYNASKYLNEFKSNVSMLNTLEIDSSFIFELNFIYDVYFYCQNKQLKLILGNEIKSKALITDLALNCDYSSNIIKKTVIFVKKNSQNDLNISLLYN
jgi:uncharacterized protein (UPF0333 family)